MHVDIFRNIYVGKIFKDETCWSKNNNGHWNFVIIWV